MLYGAFKSEPRRRDHFRQQNSGCFVHMTSNSGMAGNVGQANYGAAKAGMIRLSKHLALDMQRFNVRSELVVAPSAWTRMTGRFRRTRPTRRRASRSARRSRRTRRAAGRLSRQRRGQGRERPGVLHAAQRDFLMSQMDAACAASIAARGGRRRPSLSTHACA